MTILGIDLGKTGCRGALWADDDAPVHRGPAADPLARSAGPGAQGLAAQHGVDQALMCVLDALEQLDRAAPSRPFDALAVGCAGAHAAPAAASQLAARLASHCPEADVTVTSDAVIAHAGALGAAPGVVLSAGTGAVAIGVCVTGDVAQVDGWGPWLGDDGSGAWIGREGLAAVLRALDGRGAATQLSLAVAQTFGPDLSTLPVAITGGAHPARVLAGFAPQVAETAAAGDEVAAGILAGAATHLAASVLAAARRLWSTGSATGPWPGGIPTVLSGGLLQLGPPLLDPLTRALLAADVPLDLRAPLGSALDGARLLARRHDTVHEARLVRRSRAVVTPRGVVTS